MKTRSNMPLYVLEVSDVKTLSNAQIDLLRCGDYLVKKDASGAHAYKVTFKSATGMCITYHDASVVETQSYDKVGDNWVYNSEDKAPLPINGEVDGDISVDGDLYVDGKITAGDIQVPSINGETNPSVKPIYCHPVMCYASTKNRIMMLIFNNDGTQFTSGSLFDFIVSTDNFRVMLSGIVNDNEAVYIVKGSATTVQIVYHDTTQDNGIASLTLDKNGFVNLFNIGAIDSVHKIN